MRTFARLLAVGALNLGVFTSCETMAMPVAEASPKFEVGANANTNDNPIVNGLGVLAVTMPNLANFSTPPFSDESNNTKCRPANESVEYVVCADIEARVGSVRAAKDGVIGKKVIDAFTITPSRYDNDCGSKPKKDVNCSGGTDSITKTGKTMAVYPQKKTAGGLKWFISFSGNQGSHAYKKVGKDYDSSGCIRTTNDTAEKIWQLLVAGTEGDLVTAGKVSFHVFK